MTHCDSCPFLISQGEPASSAERQAWQTGCGPAAGSPAHSQSCPGGAEAGKLYATLPRYLCSLQVSAAKAQEAVYQHSCSDATDSSLNAPPPGLLQDCFSSHFPESSLELTGKPTITFLLYLANTIVPFRKAAPCGADCSISW